MIQDNIYDYLKFSDEFSIEDWDALINLKFRSYFINDDAFNSNKELLRTELINYIKFSEETVYVELFNWTFHLFNRCIEKDEKRAIRELAISFEEVSGTDRIWMTNVIIQPDSKKFSESDKINYSFKIIDEILEGVFKPRFKLLQKFVHYWEFNDFYDNSNTDFGSLLSNFPDSAKAPASLYLKDPIFSISTNQWRNIAAHKSFIINKDNIIIRYGKTTLQTVNIKYEQLYQIIDWIQSSYRVLRLAEVFIYLNHTKDIVKSIGGTDSLNVRFESSLLHLIHNLQIVGFRFLSTGEINETFILKLEKKKSDDLKSSVIHASQYLDYLSTAIYIDYFMRDKFQKVEVIVIDDEMKKIASASVMISVAIKKAKGEMILNEYIKNIDFSLSNFVE